MRKKEKLTVEQSIEEIGSCLVEAMSEVQQDESGDPLDVYATTVRSRLYHDKERFLQRFAKGYTALIREIMTQHSV